MRKFISELKIRILIIIQGIRGYFSSWKRRHWIMLAIVLLLLLLLGGYLIRQHHHAKSVGVGGQVGGDTILKPNTPLQPVAPGGSSPKSAGPISPTPSPLKDSDFSGKNRFGVSTGAEFFTDSDADFNTQIQGMKAMGVAWLRSTISWKGSEDSRGVYNWKRSDRLVNTASSLGIKLIANINQPPDWSKATGNYNCAGQPNPSFAIEDYAAFAKAAVLRYHDKVSVWELGNEPNHVKGVWASPNACQYTELLRQTYQNIKSVDVKATVLIGGIGGVKDSAGDMAGDTFTAALYAAGAKNYFDGISYHPYTHPDSPKTPGARGWTEMLNARKSMEQNGDSAKRIWITEYGAPVGSYHNLDGSLHDGGGEAVQAGLLSDGYEVFSTYSWAGPLCWFQYRDRITGPKQDKHLGLVSADFTKRQSWYTYQNLVNAAQ